MATVGPHHIDIRPWQSWQSTQGTWLRFQNSGYLGGGLPYNSSATTGDIAGWDVPLTAGTWTVTTVYAGNAGDGSSSVTVKLDATTVGSIVMTTAAQNLVSAISGISVAADGIVRLSYTTTDAKVMRLHHISLDRTGA